MAVTQKRRTIAMIGCGYVGTALAEALAAAGHDVVGTTRSQQRADDLRRRGLGAAILEVSDRAGLADLVRHRDAVYLTIAAGRRDADYRAVYLQGATHLAEATAQSALDRIIYTSSTSVYGQNDGRWVDEDSETAPDSDNGKVLLEAERALLGTPLLNAAGKRVHVSVVRLGGIHGPGRELADVARRFAGQSRDDGEAYVNLVHLDEIVVALAALLDVDHSGVLNLCDGAPMTRRALYDGLLASQGLAGVCWSQPPEQRATGKRVRSERIGALLGWAPDRFLDRR